MMYITGCTCSVAKQKAATNELSLAQVTGTAVVTGGTVIARQLHAASKGRVYYSTTQGAATEA